MGCLEVDPNDITGTVRAVRQAHAELGIKAVTSFPAGCNPQVPFHDEVWPAFLRDNAARVFGIDVPRGLPEASGPDAGSGQQ